MEGGGGGRMRYFYKLSKQKMKELEGTIKMYSTNKDFAGIGIDDAQNLVPCFDRRHLHIWVYRKRVKKPVMLFRAGA